MCEGLCQAQAQQARPGQVRLAGTGSGTRSRLLGWLALIPASYAAGQKGLARRLDPNDRLQAEEGN